MKKKVLILVLSLFITYESIQAQNWNQVIKTCASDRAIGDGFGRSVSISGDYAIAGAYSEDEDASGGNTMNESGSVYIFKNIAGTWVQVKKIVASDRAADDNFGSSVSISGDYAVVGSVNDDEDASGGNYIASAGSAYIFKKDQGGVDNWGQVKKITAFDRGEYDYFGGSVSISGDYVIVGAAYEDEDASGGNSTSNAGSAYIFKKDQGGTDSWGQVKKIIASDRTGSDYFGGSVSISGDYVIVGAYREDQDASGGNYIASAGSAYIFKKDQGGADSWGQVSKIVAVDRAMGDEFGGSVSISGDYVIVGAAYEDEDASGGNSTSNAGSAYIFKKDQGGINNWGQVKKIATSVRAINDYFGSAVSIFGDYVIVGAYSEDEDASGGNYMGSAGSAYIYKKDQDGTNNWGQVSKIVASDRAMSDSFGKSVSISGDYVIVAALFEDEDASGANTMSNAGSAYIFTNLPQITTQPLTQNNICVGSNISFTIDGSNIDTYQWQVDEGSGFEDITNGGVYNNTTTATLNITGVILVMNAYQYRCIVSNASGNATSDIATLTIDTENPEIPTLTTLTGECSVIATAPTTTDNCAGTVTGTTTDPTEYTEQGTYTITWNFADGNGNSIDVEQNVIVDDITNPETPTLADLTDQCSVSATAPTTTDNCAGTITGTTTDPTEYTEQGTYTITWNFADGNGNSIDVEQNVIVDDITNPTITCIDNPTKQLSEGETVYTVSGTEFNPTENNDNCDGFSIANDFNDLSTLDGAEFPIGLTIVIWTITDVANNETQCSFDVQVNAFVGIETLQQNGISIYPNPTNGIINFEFANNNIQKITISDISGKQIIKKANIQQNEMIDLLSFESGIYIITIQTDKEIFTTKIVKE